jgi:hypothetical protein
MEKTDVVVNEEDGTQTEADPEDYPHTFGLPEDPPTPGAKTSNDPAVVSDDEVAKATGQNPVTGEDDPSALSRDDDVTTEPEHWAEGHYYVDQTGMTERTERVPEDNLVNERQDDGSPVPEEGETDDSRPEAPPPDVPPAEPPPAEPPPVEDTPAE